MQPQQYPPPQYSQYQPRNCHFTCCYCCSCTYDAHCVHRTAFALDIILFGLWTLNGLGSIGRYGIYSLIYILLVVFFFIQVVLAIIHLCKYQQYIANGILRQKVTTYLKIRMYMCIYMIVVGIIVGLIYLFVLRAYIKNNRVIDPNTGYYYDDSAATAYGISAFLGVLIPLIVDVGILYGYKKSFDDSTNALAGTPNAVSDGGHHHHHQGGAFDGVQMNQGVYQGVYQGAPPMAIGGSSQHHQPHHYQPQPYQPQQHQAQPYQPQMGPVQPTNQNSPVGGAQLPPGFVSGVSPQRNMQPQAYK